MSVPNSVPPLADISQNSHVRPGQASTFGLYIHVPFCLRKCAYCDFYSVAVNAKLADRYLTALSTQIRQTAREIQHLEFTPKSIFFGGGTPTVLGTEQLLALLRECEREFFCRADRLETSIEVNPATVAEHDYAQLRQAGFNRISIGVQTLDDGELAAIGRPHTAAEARQAVSLARRAGFSNLSLDLMYGLPGQNFASWQQTLERALALDPDHLSIYELTLAQGTPMAGMVERGLLRLPDEDQVLSMLEHSVELTARAGMERYEISSYARSGYTCGHNINYWQNGAYLGLGPAAVSCLSGRRLNAVADVEQFCGRMASRGSVWEEEEALNREERFRETVIMGLRMLKGVSLSALEERFSINAVAYYGPILERLQQQKLIILARDRLYLSDQGLLLANRVMAELV